MSFLNRLASFDSIFEENIEINVKSNCAYLIDGDIKLTNGVTDNEVVVTARVDFAKIFTLSDGKFVYMVEVPDSLYRRLTSYKYLVLKIPCGHKLTLVKLEEQ